ncbi:MAG TPA: flagellar hook-basal body complex protein FliE [Allosphingosinicella sp.]|nr:flagellar hook-basal body complex protein FliE [Allosphingosinicella sp.]
MSIPPIPAVAAALASPDLLAAARAAAPPAGASFSQILLDGMEAVNRRVVQADAMVRAFAVDDSVPLHQVTFALEEARLSVELMMQVRARLVESYQRMMEMQL